MDPSSPRHIVGAIPYIWVFPVDGMLLRRALAYHGHELLKAFAIGITLAMPFLADLNVSGTIVRISNMIRVFAPHMHHRVDAVLFFVGRLERLRMYSVTAVCLRLVA
jgi:hypothetical protein